MISARRPVEDNRKKLRRLLGYLKRTIKLPLILRADGLIVLKWWVDASYAAHDDMRGHTVGNYLNGKGRAQINNQYIEEAKAKHKELDRGRTLRGGQRDATDAMYNVLPGSQRIWNRQEYIVSRQYECDVIGK